MTRLSRAFGLLYAIGAVGFVLLLNWPTGLTLLLLAWPFALSVLLIGLVSGTALYMIERRHLRRVWE
jgi:hypothetical protein